MEKSLAISTYDEIEKAALAMSKSGYFQDVKDQAQAVVKILAGRELGFGPFASMQNIFIINGRPSVGANLMASAVKGSPKYDYKIRDLTGTACAIEFYQLSGGKYESIGVSKFTIEDAKKAQTKNLEKYPRNMLFARAMSNGVRWYCPDVFNGNAVYTPEELGADVDGEGNVINATFAEVKQSNNGHEPEPLPFEPKMDIETAKPVTHTENNGKKVRTLNENLSDLGFEPEPEAEFEPKMSIETAKDITTSQGKRYGDLDKPAWLSMKKNIAAALGDDELTPEQRTTYQYKLDALNVLINS
jgi:hypothetical protein